RSFQTTSLEPPKELDRSAAVRYERLILAYRAALAAANFNPPASLQRAKFKNLFGKELREAMQSSQTSDGHDLAVYQETASIVGKDTGTWDEAVRAMQGLRR